MKRAFLGHTFGAVWALTAVFAIGAVCAIGASGCGLSDDADKHACQVQDDCLAGFTCLANQCTPDATDGGMSVDDGSSPGGADGGGDLKPVAPSCTDHVQNGHETDVDCGGSCTPCAVGRSCTVTSDCAAGTCESQQCLAGRWASLADMPTPRLDLATVWGPDGRLYALGGISQAAGGLDVVEAYNPTANSWTTLAPMANQRYGFAAVTGSDGRIYAIGGAYQGTTSPFSDGISKTVEAYDPKTNQWTPVASLGTSRYRAAAVAAGDGHIYVFGGFDYSVPRQSASAEVYDLASNKWSPLSFSMTTARSGHAAAVAADGHVFAFGGLDNQDNKIAAVESFLPGTIGWSTAPPMPTPRAWLAAARGADGRLYALGGNSFNSGPDPKPSLTVAEAFSPSSNSWSTVASMPTDRYGLAAVASPDGKIYALGGTRVGGFGSGTELRTLEVFTPAP